MTAIPVRRKRDSDFVDDKSIRAIGVWQ